MGIIFLRHTLISLRHPLISLHQPLISQRHIVLIPSHTRTLWWHTPLTSSSHVAKLPFSPIYAKLSHPTLVAILNPLITILNPLITMKRTLYSILLVTAGLFPPLSSVHALSEVHLTFTRTGAEVAGVTVAASDEAQQPLAGVTATLVSLTGEASTDLSLMTATALGTSALAPTGSGYGNVAGSAMHFLFKIDGLTDFRIRGIDLSLKAINAQGGDQSAAVSRNFTFAASLASAADYTANGTLADFGSTDGNINASPTNYTVWSLAGAARLAEETYLMVSLTKNEALGCYAALNEVVLQVAPTTVALSQTANFGYVATFSATVATQIPDGITAYKAVNATATTIELQPVGSQVLPAYVGVILRTDDAALATADLYQTLDSSEATFYDNLLQPMPEGGMPVVPTGTVPYVLVKDDTGNAVFRQLNMEGSGFASNKVYLLLNSSLSPFMQLQLTIDPLTAIDHRLHTPHTPSAACYDLQGRHLNQRPVVGIVIMQGKKYIFR